MPDLVNYFVKQETRLDISKYFDGQEAWITIKKIPLSVRKKLEHVGADKVMFKIANLNKDNATSGIAEMSSDEIKKISEISRETNEIYLEYGVDPIKHNFTIKGETQKLNIDFWENMPDDLILFVIESIKSFTSGGIMGESIGAK